MTLTAHVTDSTVYEAYEYLTQQHGLSEPTAARYLYEVGRFGHISLNGIVVVSAERDGYVRVYPVTDLCSGTWSHSQVTAEHFSSLWKPTQSVM